MPYDVAAPQSSPLGGSAKRSQSLLARAERHLAAMLVRIVPAQIQSYHLTLFTVLWSGCVLAAAGLASAKDIRWMWLSSAVIVCQYLTDAVDGKVGALRGRVRWGFYMDHLLDYVFLCAVMLGYAALVPSGMQWMMAALTAVSGAFMASAFLQCSLVGRLEISYLRVGPLEIRLTWIAINTWLATGGRAALNLIVPGVLIVAIGVLATLVFRTQRQLHVMDVIGARPRATPQVTGDVVKDRGKNCLPLGDSSFSSRCCRGL